MNDTLLSYIISWYLAIHIERLVHVFAFICNSVTSILFFGIERTLSYLVPRFVEHRLSVTAKGHRKAGDGAL